MRGSDERGFLLCNDAAMRSCGSEGLVQCSAVQFSLVCVVVWRNKAGEESVKETVKEFGQSPPRLYKGL